MVRPPAPVAEQLAAETGMYDGDPFGDIGRLQAELHRAVRLVTEIVEDMPFDESAIEGWLRYSIAC